MKKRLFVVTLPWDSRDREQGDFSSKVWATSMEPAIKMVATEMADCSVGEMTRKERAQFIKDRIEDGGCYPVDDVLIRIQIDIDDLMAGPKNRPLTNDQNNAKRVILGLLQLYGG